MRGDQGRSPYLGGSLLSRDRRSHDRRRAGRRRIRRDRLTSLTKEAMPVIRYRTGDLTRLLPGTARPMRRMEKVSGRSDDMMIVRGVNVFPSQIEELILRVPSLSPHYQLILTREGRLDELEVQAEARSSELDLAHAAGELAHAMKSRIGVSAKVSVLKPGAIERSLGKAKRVIDKRPKA